MSRTLELAGWALAVGAIAAAAIARHRMAILTHAVARTCHELRGPLTAAQLGLLLAFRSGQLADVRLRALELDLGRATLALEDLSRVSAAEPSLRPVAAPLTGGEEVDIARLLAESVEAWAGLASAYGAELRLLRSPGRAVACGERLRVAQAIGNLVANAVEHGGGVVEIGWRVHAANVTIEVTDQGLGLPALLSELVRGRRRRSQRGHGLAIAATIAEAYGGRLTSAPSERGARLVLELPRRD